MSSFVSCVSLILLNSSQMISLISISTPVLYLRVLVFPLRSWMFDPYYTTRRETVQASLFPSRSKDLEPSVPLNCSRHRKSSPNCGWTGKGGKRETRGRPREVTELGVTSVFCFLEQPLRVCPVDGPVACLTFPCLSPGPPLFVSTQSLSG